jgi:DNA-binding NtrC family response regulator
VLIESPSLAERVERVLRQPDVIASVTSGGEDLWACLSPDACDLVVATREVLPEPYSAAVATVRALPDAPELVVLAEEGDAEFRAALQAAGVFAVVPRELSEESLRKAMNTLIRRRREALLRRFRTAPDPEAQPVFRESRSEAMRELLGLADRVAGSDSSLLVLGPTGVGKEWLARRIHSQGPRAEGPFVAVNCGALPSELVESELFGHTEGAFTGATRGRRGQFELAHRGTLFLDEIAEMPVQAQVKLLRAIQDREIRRLGSEQSIEVDTRIIAATNRSPERAIREGSLRQDLYYRLSVVSLTVPGLRERTADIPHLADQLLDQLRAKVHRPDVRRISATARAALQGYSWPGNVRELINVLERALLLCRGTEITPEDLPASVTGGAAVHEIIPDWEDLLDAPLPEARDTLLERFEREYLARLLQETGGSIGAVARRAGIDERTLYNKMRRYGLRKEAFRTGSS